MDGNTIFQRIVEFDDLCEQLQHPLGVDPNREVIGELQARRVELERLGLDIHPCVGLYLTQVNARLGEV
ncbi:MAG: hypothetical protein AAGA29_07225 [Planctomycetota bacterium]